MDVYFIRHGQTDGNVARRHQHPDTPTNEMGREQAIAVAREVQLLQPTHLITSTHVRALLTAKEISKVCDLVPETHPAFGEFRRPNFLIGERFISLTTISYIWRWWRGFADSHMHTGESHKDFVDRVSIARQYLEKLPPNAKVVVVSHSVFINFFLEHMCNPKQMGIFRAALRLLKIFTLPNTSIIHIRYNAKSTKKICAWRLVR